MAPKPAPPESNAELILHPVRMRVIQVLGTGRQLTAQQLAEALPDVPPATLYRQLNKLLGAGILEVVAQRQVRGAQEKTFALKGNSASIDPAELATMSRDDHMRYFTTFLATLIGDFGRYLQRETIDLVADGVGYRSLPLNLTDIEFRQMAEALHAALRPFVGLPDSPDRRIRSFSTIFIPGAAAPTSPEA